MPSFQNIRDRLPSLYRPEDDDQSLLSTWLRAVGSVLDRMDRETNDVLRSHWFPYADQAPFQPYFLRVRLLQKTEPLVPLQSDAAVQLFPYIQDLARLAMLFPIAPWEQPASVSETVEEYRRRIARIVAVYRGGLGVLGALRGMVEAQLPANRGASPEQLDRPFWLEEFAPLGQKLLRVPPRGEPLDLVGPLMRWTVDNDGLAGAAPTIYIQGVHPQADTIDATERPLIELYEADGHKVRIGIGYTDTLAPDQTLRLRPSGRSWLGLADGLMSAESLPVEAHAADPTAPGPWSTVAGAPAAAVAAIYQTSDLMLWVAAGEDLHAYDGAAWTDGPAGLSPIHALAEDSGDLLIGVETGLLRMPLHPVSGPLTASPVAALDGQRVNTIFRAAGGQLWLGCENGAFILGAGDTAIPAPLQKTEVFAMAQDQTGSFYFGCSLGLFQWQPAGDAWYWYEGKDGGVQAAQWQRWFPGKPPAQSNFPTAQQPFLPPVIRIRRGRDAALWLGTQNGIARYTAVEAGALQFESRLEAFPDLTAGPAPDLAEDARGLMWFASDRGLFRFDGRDLWQYRAAPGWTQMGRADTMYPGGADRGTWRFNRATSQWERFDTVWSPFTAGPRSTPEAGITAIAWTAGVLADLGQWDGAQFSNPAAADAGKLAVRFKPSEDRIVAGGIPGIPALPVGGSVWRYLSIEPEAVELPVDRPFWTTEGRLVLPPQVPDAPGEGRYDVEVPPPPSDFDEAVFAYNPAAAVWFEWSAPRPLAVLVRLKRLAPDETIDPAVVERVFSSAQQVRPAGVRVSLAVEEDSSGITGG